MTKLMSRTAGDVTATVNMESNFATLPSSTSVEKKNASRTSIKTKSKRKRASTGTAVVTSVCTWSSSDEGEPVKLRASASSDESLLGRVSSTEEFEGRGTEFKLKKRRRTEGEGGPFRKLYKQTRTVDSGALKHVDPSLRCFDKLSSESEMIVKDTGGKQKRRHGEPVRSNKPRISDPFDLDDFKEISVTSYQKNISQVKQSQQSQIRPNLQKLSNQGTAVSQQSASGNNNPNSVRADLSGGGWRCRVCVPAPSMSFVSNSQFSQSQRGIPLNLTVHQPTDATRDAVNNKESPPNKTPRKRRPRLPADMRICNDIVQDLLAKKNKSWTYPFYRADYKGGKTGSGGTGNIFEKPMYLYEIKAKLNSRQYASAEEFAADFNLMIENFLQHYPPEHPFHEYALQMRVVFDKGQQQILHAKLGNFGLPKRIWASLPNTGTLQSVQQPEMSVFKPISSGHEPLLPFVSNGAGTEIRGVVDRSTSGNASAGLCQSMAVLKTEKEILDQLDCANDFVGMKEEVSSGCSNPASPIPDAVYDENQSEVETHHQNILPISILDLLNGEENRPRAGTVGSLSFKPVPFDQARLGAPNLLQTERLMTGPGGGEIGSSIPNGVGVNTPASDDPHALKSLTCQWLRNAITSVGPNEAQAIVKAVAGLLGKDLESTERILTHLEEGTPETLLRVAEAILSVLLPGVCVARDRGLFRPERNAEINCTRWERDIREKLSAAVDQVQKQMSEMQADVFETLLKVQKER